MYIKRRGRNVFLPIFIVVILVFFTVVPLPSIKGFPAQSTAWAGNSGWSDAFGSSADKNSAFPQKSGAAGGNWNTVVDDNSYNSSIVNRGNSEKNTFSEPSGVSTSDPSPAAAPVNQPEALELIDTLMAANQPAEIPPTLYINNMTKVQYAGAVSMAMEGMRLFYGDMDEDQELLFESQWLPLFRYPSEEIIFYVNRLNPLLLQFLTLKTAINDCIDDFNATQLSVVVCTEIGDAQGVSDAMETSVIYAIANKTLNNRLQLVGKKIIALGDPPNAAGLMKKARQQYEDALRELLPPLTITPATLNAVPGREYTFKIKIADYEKYRHKDKLSLSCQGREKIKDGVLTIKKTFHKKIGSTENFTVELHQYPGPKILGSVTARITMVDNPGCWTLVDCHTYETGPGPFLTAKIDQKESHIESSLAPPSFLGNILHFGYISRWETPLKKLSPKAEMQIPVSITRNHPCAVCWETRNKLSSDAYKAYGKEKTEILKKLADYETSLYNCYDKSNNAVSMTISLITDPELSKRIENNPLNNGSLGKSVAKLKSGNHRTETSLIQTVPSGIQEDRYDKNKPNLIFLHVQIKNSFYYSKNCNDINREAHSTVIAGVVYTYKWDPSGNQIKPLDIDGQEDAGDMANSAELAAGEREKAEKIIFHQHNIKCFTKNIDGINRQITNIAELKLDKKQEVDIREKLNRNLLYAQDALQREIDAVTTIQTGKFVRTRTGLDALNMKIMAEQSHLSETKLHRDRRIKEHGARMIKLAPKADRIKLRQFFNRHVMAGDVSKEERAEAIKAIYNRVSGAIEVEKSAHEEDAQYWDENLRMAQYTKTGAEVAMMCLSFTGAGASYTLFGHFPMTTASGVYMAYSATTGYVEGGPKEAVSRTLAAYNTGTTIINAGMQGYQAGVLQNLEEYAQNPEKVALDEAKAGFKGAAWSAGTAAAFAVAIKFGMNAYHGRRQTTQQTTRNRKTSFKLKYDQAQQNIRLRYFRSRTIAGAKKVKIFRQRQIALSQARQANASRSEISRLRCELDKSYKGVKTDYFAKKIMKSMATRAQASFHTPSGRAHHKTVHTYNSIDRRFTGQLKARLSERMTKAGYSQQKYKTFSNSASSGGIGMDVDMGAIEPPRYIIIKGGRRVANPEHPIWRRNITRTVNGVTRRASPHELQQTGQKELAAAFHDIYGVRPGEAMVSYTTSYHPEAYRDPRWLGSKRCKTALVYETDPKWTQQAADVTDFKINTMDTHNPSLGYYGKMQENCRGLVKDYTLKLKPLLKHSTNPKARDRIEKIMAVMKQFSNNKIGPVKAEQMLRILTGNRDGVREVSQRFGIMLRGLKNGL